MHKLALAALAVAFVSSAARAEPRFGDRDELVPYGSVSLTYSGSTADGSSGTTSINFSPALLSFVTQNVAIGGQLTIQYVSSGASSQITVGTAPVLGFNAWLGEHVSLFPQITLVIGYTSFSSTFSGMSESTGSLIVQPEIAVPILFHPVAHFFLGFGPSAQVSFYSNSSASTSYVVGVTSIIGGWF